MSGQVRGDDRWELGSDFHLMSETGSGLLPWATRPHSLWGSGRDAIRALFDWGREEHGWRSLLVPSYFCQEVVGSIARSVPVRSYPWGPLTGPYIVSSRVRDVVLVPALFGARPSVSVDGPAMTIEDHSHDLLAPWVKESRADYAIASLRKTLPLPDGGVIWSPKDRSVPSEEPLTGQHASSALLRLSAMILKRDYLLGEMVAKPAFRDMSVAGERTIASGPPSGISAFSRERLHTVPAQEWRARRARNLEVLRARLRSVDAFEILDIPFALMLLFSHAEERDRVRKRLIDMDVYPSVLWSLDDPAVEGIPDEHIDLSHRILAIACDQRYSVTDMERVASVVERAVATTRGLESARSRDPDPVA